MKYKQRLLIVLVLAVVLPIMLTGCKEWDSFKSEYDLFMRELPDILEFFTPRKWSEEDSQHVIMAQPDEQSENAIDMLTHTEIIESPFNSASSIVTVQSVGDATVGDAPARKLTDEEIALYTAVPCFDEYGAMDVARLFESYGIVAELVLRTNTAPEGEVFAIRYAGEKRDGYYYVNPQAKVTLYVSADKVTDTEKKGHNLVYLTFDDGPSEDTEKLLDILDTYGVKAAFFTLGTAVEKNPEAAAAIVARGHVLGCHSHTHDYEKIYSSSAALEAEVKNWEGALQSAGIYLKQKTFRFPGGSVGGYLAEEKVPAMQSMLENRGYLIFDWSVSINDAVLYLAPEEQSSYDYIKECFIASLEQRVRINQNKDGAPLIILMHENVDETLDLLPWIIEYLVDRGYTFGDLANFDSSWMFER